MDNLLSLRCINTDKDGFHKPCYEIDRIGCPVERWGSKCHKCHFFAHYSIKIKDISYYQYNFLASPNCKYKCVNCINKYGFEHSDQMTLTYNYGSKLRYYVIKVNNLCHDNPENEGGMVEFPLNHKSKYNNELEQCVKSIINMKISNHSYDIKLNCQFILHLKVLYTYGNLPQELVLPIMLYMFY